MRKTEIKRDIKQVSKAFKARRLGGSLGEDWLIFESPGNFVAGGAQALPVLQPVPEAPGAAY